MPPPDEVGHDPPHPAGHHGAREAEELQRRFIAEHLLIDIDRLPQGSPVVGSRFPEFIDEFADRHTGAHPRLLYCIPILKGHDSVTPVSGRYWRPYTLNTLCTRASTRRKNISAVSPAGQIGILEVYQWKSRKNIGLHENPGCWVLNARQGMTCLPTRDDPARPAVSASPVFSAGPISRESGFLGMGSRRPTQRISPRVSVPFSMHTRFCGSVRSVTGTPFFRFGTIVC